jgi:hypothetical protein
MAGTQAARRPPRTPAGAPNASLWCAPNGHAHMLTGEQIESSLLLVSSGCMGFL